MRKHFRTALLSTAPFLLTATLLWLISYSVDFSAVVQQLSSINLVFFFVATLLVILNIAVATLRYQSIIFAYRHDGPAPFLPLMQLNLLSLFSAHFLPVGALADGMRVIISRKILKIGVRAALESVVTDRGLAAIGQTAVGLLLLPIQIAENWPIRIIALQTTVFGGVLAAITLGTLASFFFKDSLGSLGMLGRRFIGHLATPRRALWQATLALGAALLFAGMFKALAFGLGIDIPFHIALAVAPAIYLSQVIPIFYAGFGSREIVLASILVTAGILSDSQAVTVGLAVGLCNLAASLPGAVFFWPLLRSAQTD